MWDEDMVPYRTMRRELPMVLIGHANYPAVTNDRLPASLSKKWITDILRKKIGYRGLIVSDDMEMGGGAEGGSDRAGRGGVCARRRRSVFDLPYRKNWLYAGI